MVKECAELICNMQSDIKISVIVPIYNTEKYLHRCVDSILNQTFRDFELILVDDGSTDSSGEICDRYAKNDVRVKVIHKENSGTSDAKNCAMDIASGKYIIFADSDDFWYVENVLQTLYNKSEEYNLDIIRGEYKAVDEQDKLVFSRPISKNRLKFSNSVIKPYEYIRYAVNNEFFLWLCLIRKDFIGDLRFESGRIYLEDMKFISQLLLNEGRCMYMPSLRFYAYRKHNHSISYQVNEKKLKDSFDMCDFFYEMSKESGCISMSRYFQKSCIERYYGTLYSLVNNCYYINHKRYIKEFKLNTLQKKICRRIIEFRFRNLSLIYFLPPSIVIIFFRIKYTLLSIKNFIIKKIK